VPHVDTGLVIEVDIENDAKRLFEIVVILKRLSRRKRETVVPVLPQQTLHPLERPGIIINDKNCFSALQDDILGQSADWLFRLPNASS
jgi:hypothetical protein